AHGIGEDVVRPSGGIKYDDVELAQDACAQTGLRLGFGKTNDPAVTGQAATPYVSGLSPTGTLDAAKTKSPKVYGTPLVACQQTRAAEQQQRPRDEQGVDEELKLAHENRGRVVDRSVEASGRGRSGLRADDHRQRDRGELGAANSRCALAPERRQAGLVLLEA